MAVNSVNFGATRPYGYNPKTHQFDPEQAKKDFKPGLFDPEAQKRSANRRVKVATGLLAGTALAALGFVFRTPIAKAAVVGFEKAVEIGKPLVSKGVEYAGKAVTYLKENGQMLLGKAIKFFAKNNNAVS